MDKKSQIAVFIIIGIVILAAVLFFLYFRQISASSERVSPIDTAPFDSFVSSCLDSTSKDAVVYVGQHGGFFELPTGSDEILKLPYYLKEDKLSWPSKNQVENELAKYVDSELRFCLENFRSFKGVAVDFDASKTTSLVYDRKIIFSTDFPITIKQGSATAKLDKFNSEVNTKLGTIINVTDSYMQIQKNDTSTICISCLLDLVNKNNLSINLGNVENSTFVFTITDKEIPRESNKYEYSFLMQYNFGAK